MERLSSPNSGFDLGRVGGGACQNYSLQSEPGRCYFAMSSMMKKWFYLKKKRPP